MKGDWYARMVDELGLEGAKAEMRRRRSLRKSKIGGFSLMDKEKLREYGRINGRKGKRGKSASKTPQGT